MKVCFFTSAATNYLSKALVLGRSVKRHHPNVDLFYALADELSPSVDYKRGVFDGVLEARTLGIPNFTSWAFSHNIVELSTAIKPYAAESLFERGYDLVVYLDPDIVVFSPLDEIFDEAERATLLLTPHVTEPEVNVEQIIGNEICTLQHGVFNLGFFAVRNTREGRRIMRWWRDRCYNWCEENIAGGLFTDQKWLDLAPGMFEGVKILRSPRYNVAPWNISTRKISGSLDGGLTVEGLPLAFYHFTGFDSGAHRRAAKKNDGSNRTLWELIDYYENATSLSSEDPASKVGWAFGTYANGKPIANWHRVMYRHHPGLSEKFTAPFSDAQLQRWFELHDFRERMKRIPFLVQTVRWWRRRTAFG